MKTCTKCGKEYPVTTEFFPWDKRRNAAQSRCRACARVATAAWCSVHPEAARAAVDRWQAAHPEACRANSSRWNATHPEVHRQSNARWLAAHPEKGKAHNAVGNAVRYGRATRPDNCSRCGKAEKIHLHHEDYSKPLETVALCPQCHGAIHRAKHVKGGLA